jgi:microcystin-dependent protein
MSQPYVGEIRIFAGNFAPAGWMFCNGSLIAIGQNETLFNLIGTTYGGDGQQTFALPDLRGRVPVHQGQGSGLSARTMGEFSGTETVTITPNQMAVHRHTLKASSSLSNGASGPGGVLAATAVKIYDNISPPSDSMAAQAVSPQGGGQPHNNMAPFLGISYIISLFGVFPSQA